MSMSSNKDEDHFIKQRLIETLIYETQKRTQYNALICVIRECIKKVELMGMTDLDVAQGKPQTEKENNTQFSLALFTASLDLRNHPMLKAKEKRRATYFTILEYFSNRYCANNYYIKERLALYKRAILRDTGTVRITSSNQNQVIRSLINSPIKPWVNKYRYLLLCDLALILIDEQTIRCVYDEIKAFLTHKQAKLLDELKEALLTHQSFSSYPALTNSSIIQYHANREYIAKKGLTYIVTANMSAGKSTLINALTGKIISCMKNEAFTAELHYICDKPYEDGHTSEWDGVFTMEANEQTLMDYDARNNTGKVFVATHFSSLVQTDGFRFCFIDTPGVNSAINREHGKLTRRALKEESYDRLIYIFNANRLGTDDENRHLKFVAENVPHEKIIFVLNKLDDFNLKDDSIDVSIAGIRSDLNTLGFDKPLICPISAYFALLVKKVLTGAELSDDESDSYHLFLKKFSGNGFDLSRYYPSSPTSNDINNVEIITAAQKCGLLGLESILYGGVNKE